MTERQRDLFLYLWSRRRAPGRTRIALRGAIIGALGGVAFASILVQGGVSEPGLRAYDFLGQIRSVVRPFVIAVPVFALIGWVNARRVWTSQERLYQSLLAAGARVPAQKPVVTMRDRGPMLAVAVVALAIGGFIVVLVWAYATGNL